MAAIAGLFLAFFTLAATLPPVTLAITLVLIVLFGLIVGAPDDATNVRFNALELSRAWPGAVLRTVSKSEATGLAENRRFAKFAGLGGSDRGTQPIVNAGSLY